jgi:hypothetical protein
MVLAAALGVQTITVTPATTAAHDRAALAAALETQQT